MRVAASLAIRYFCNASLSGAAELLLDVHNPFLIYEGDENEVKEYPYIITPWDIVMKLNQMMLMARH
ncbi:MAG: hypothetical protein WAK17_16320 [Candidatus Nitrosopolaris sp.]